jgi:3-deoxy-7-phosphoheptulonate synthase
MIFTKDKGEEKMIVVMKKTATEKEIDAVVKRITDMGLQPHISQGEERTIIGIVGHAQPIDRNVFEMMNGVEKTVPILSPFKLSSRDFKQEDTVIRLNGVKIGGEKVVIMAGPCSVESREQLLETAHAVKEAGATILRGGAFKPRTSPYSFRGLGLKGLELLAEAREETGLYIITEALSAEKVSLVAGYTDIIQIGARNMQNYALLEAVGATNKPVMLKRGMMATMQELLMSAEYILSKGNTQVMLCERGIRTFETYTRNTFDINAIPALKMISHLPVIADPSHGTGKWELVTPVARAAIAAGADGIIVEVHPRPEEALSDGAQSLKPEKFAALVKQVKAIAESIGRSV